MPDSAIRDKKGLSLEEEIMYFLDSENHIKEGIKIIFSVIKPEDKRRYDSENLLNCILALSESEPKTFNDYKFEDRRKKEYLWFVNRAMRHLDKEYIERGIRIISLLLKPNKGYKYDSLKLFYTVNDMCMTFPFMFDNHGFDLCNRKKRDNYVDVILECMEGMEKAKEINVEKNRFEILKTIDSDFVKKCCDVIKQKPDERGIEYLERKDVLLSIIKERLY